MLKGIYMESDLQIRLYPDPRINIYRPCSTGDESDDHIKECRFKIQVGEVGVLCTGNDLSRIPDNICSYEF